MERTLCRARPKANANPTGPPPTIRTGASFIVAQRRAKLGDVQLLLRVVSSTVRLTTPPIQTMTIGRVDLWLRRPCLWYRRLSHYASGFDATLKLSLTCLVGSS